MNGIAVMPTSPFPFPAPRVGTQGALPDYTSGAQVSTVLRPDSLDSLSKVESKLPSDAVGPTQRDPSESATETSRRHTCEVNPRAVLRKLDVRIMPLVTLLYILEFLDKTNIGNAKIAGLVVDLRLKGLEYNICSAIFFITYCLFEIPCNLVMKLMRPSIWLPLTMFCWSVVMVSMAFVKSFGGLFAARIALGMTEAALSPGVTFYLCSWYPRAAQAQRISIVLSSTSIAGAFGGVLAYEIEKLSGVASLGGWSWIFLLEGLVTTVVALLGFAFMYDYPESAPFLTDAERTWLLQTIKEDNAGLSKRFEWKFLWQALRDPHAYCMIGMVLFSIIPAFTFVLFLPTIINDLGFSAAHAQLLTVPPNALGWVTTILFGVLSDRYCARGPFVLVGAVFALAGCIVLFATTSPGAGYAGVMIATSGLAPITGCLLAWAGGNIGGDVKKAVVIAMTIGFGNLGGVVSSFIFRPQDAPRYLPGYAVDISFLCAIIALSIFLMFDFTRLNRKKIAQCAREGITEESAGEYVDMGDASPLFRYTI